MQLAGTSNFEWLRRCPQICATFVLRQTGRDAFARFGGDPADLEVRDPSQAAALWSWDNNFKPVLRIGGRDGWTVIVEEFSAEGARPEVLRSVSAGTRAFSVLLSGSGMVWFSHATSGRIDCAFEPSGASQQRRSQVIDLAAMADVSVEALMTSDGRVPDTTLHWAAVICGFPLDDALFGSLASSGLVLPLLADPRLSAPLPAVRAAIDAVDEQRLAHSLLDQVWRMVVDDGLTSYPEVVDALRAVADGNWDRPVMLDSSPIGRVLRELAARAHATQTARNDPRCRRIVSEQDRLAAARQAKTGRVLHALLTSDRRAVAAALVGEWLSGEQRKRFFH